MNFEKVTAYLDSLSDSYGIPGLDCKIVMHREEIYRHRCGFSDHARTRPVDGTELYDVFSATKVLTMTAVMQLEEQGKLSLKDPVSKYLPMFRDTKVADDYEYIANVSPMPSPEGPGHVPVNPILLEDLMGMTSGMSYDLHNPMVQSFAEKTNGDTLTMMQAIAGLPLLFEPGTHYCYSLGHDVMAAVVEVVSGERFADYLKHHIFEPLGLKTMTLHPGPAEKPRMAKQWTVEYPEEKVVPDFGGNGYRLTDNYDSGGAGLCCSVDDYAAFASAMACGGVGPDGTRILTMESIEKMRTPRLSKQQAAEFGRGHLGYNYGLGVRTMVDPKRAKSPVGEFGWDGAAGAFALMDTDNEIGVFYAQQVVGMWRVYFEVHPKLRDLIYEAIFEL